MKNDKLIKRTILAYARKEAEKRRWSLEGRAKAKKDKKLKRKQLKEFELAKKTEKISGNKTVIQVSKMDTDKRIGYSTL